MRRIRLLRLIIAVLWVRVPFAACGSSSTGRACMYRFRPFLGVFLSHRKCFCETENILGGERNEPFSEST